MGVNIFAAFGVLFVLGIGSFIFFSAPGLSAEEQQLIEGSERLISNGLYVLENIEKQDNLRVLYRHSNSFCKQVAENTLAKFRDLRVSDLGSNPPSVIVLSFDEKRVELRGSLACSEVAIQSLVCTYIENPPEFCLSFELRQIEFDLEQDVIEDLACYTSCLVKFDDGNRSVIQSWTGYPCNPAIGFVEGQTQTISRHCETGQCESDPQDIACCNTDNCVNDGKCFVPNTVQDVGKDGSREICYQEEGRAMWIDPDRSEELCRAGFDWLDGSCCGDDGNEKVASCIGNMCETAAPTCCPLDSCNYDGQCYNQGCAVLTTSKGEQFNAYCEGRTGRWIDLDKGFCTQCLGEEHFLTGTCCGDDIGEGNYPRQYQYENSDGELIQTNEVICSDTPSGCFYENFKVVFDEGCYELAGDLDGFYQCQDSTWQPANASEEQCNSCGFAWTGSCCGDNPGEHYVYGTDGSAACCQYPTQIVINGVCQNSPTCGDGILQSREQCEPPGEENSDVCIQTTELCRGNKVGIRDELGSCTEACSCQEDQFEFVCQAGMCGAECSDDGTGCLDGEVCDSTCKCFPPRGECGNDICEEDEDITCAQDCVDKCPIKASIQLDSEEYFTNELPIISIKFLDENDRILPKVSFIVEIVKDQNIISSQKLTTPKAPILFRRTEERKPNRAAGDYDYIIRSQVPSCPVVGASDTAHFTKSDEPDILYSNSQGLVLRDNTPILSQYTPRTLQGVSECGDGVVGAGEACEIGICRPSTGCNYQTRTVDIEESCNACRCTQDITSSPDGIEYCSQCQSCGDGVLNCGEECDSQSVETEVLYCNGGQLFQKINSCQACNIVEDGFNNDIVVDSCNCDASDITEQCIDGDYIEAQSYSAGCTNAQCNACKFIDTYTKDSDNDGIEDKCEVEICNNGIDDNDNGLVDKEEAVCQVCVGCGSGLFDLCDQNECTELGSCYFESRFFGGLCNSCTNIDTCEGYGNNKQTCEANHCSLGNCLFEEGSCCTDTDADGLCDNVDNCPNNYNPDQEDSDADGAGDYCDIDLNNDGCSNEFTGDNDNNLGPGKATVCSNSCTQCISGQCVIREENDNAECGTCNFCDGNNLECGAQTSETGYQCESACTSCQAGTCTFRNQCDQSECEIGEYCSGNDFECVPIDDSQEVCLVCAQSEVAWTGTCCGDQAFEYPTNGVCCTEQDQCGLDGSCYDSSEVIDTELCYEGNWFSCDASNSCETLGDLTCSKSTTWQWREQLPTEICDGADNNCNGVVDEGC